MTLESEELLLTILLVVAMLYYYIHTRIMRSSLFMKDRTLQSEPKEIIFTSLDLPNTEVVLARIIKVDDHGIRTGEMGYPQPYLKMNNQYYPLTHLKSIPSLRKEQLEQIIP